MNIQEAILSGRPFRCKTTHPWLVFDVSRELFHDFEHPNITYSVRPSEIIGNVWELMPIAPVSFDCIWYRKPVFNESDLIFPSNFSNKGGCTVLEPFIGKRTRVTVEVIE